MKLNFLIIPVLVGMMLYATAPLSAQDEQFACDLSALQKAIDVYINELGKLKDGKETDVKKISDTLQEMANTANITRATCDGLAFTGKSQKVIGPVEIPAGTYRATFSTKGFATVTVVPSEGECGASKYLDDMIFNFNKGDGVPGAESIFISKGCTVLIQIERVDGDWSLKFERVTVGS